MKSITQVSSLLRECSTQTIAAHSQFPAVSTQSCSPGLPPSLSLPGSAQAFAVASVWSCLHCACDAVWGPFLFLLPCSFCVVVLCGCFVAPFQQLMPFADFPGTCSLFLASPHLSGAFLGACSWLSQSPAPLMTYLHFLRQHSLSQGKELVSSSHARPPLVS